MYRRVPHIRWVPLALLVVLVVLVAGLLVFEHNLRPTIKEFAEAQARWAATAAVNRAIKDEIASVDYSQLIMVQKDNQGRIVLMQPNIVRINQLASDTTLAIQSSLESLADQQFSIPVGQVLGSQLLAAYGPKIRLTLYPLGTVRTGVFDKFEEAGINQTRHRIYLDIEADVKVVVPLITSNVTVSTQVPVTDTVIVGQVPNVYGNFYIGGSP